MIATEHSIELAYDEPGRDDHFSEACYIGRHRTWRFNEEIESRDVTVSRRAAMEPISDGGKEKQIGEKAFESPAKQLLSLCQAIRKAANLVIEMGSPIVSTNYIVHSRRLDWRNLVCKKNCALMTKDGLDPVA